MARSPVAEDDAARIDAALAAWRQGDFARDENWFVHIGDPEQPLTPEALQAAESESSGALTLMATVPGLVLVSQTCDIVRGCLTRPFVEVAPLVEVDEDELMRIHRGHYPSRATVPGMRAHGLAVDLDRVMTVEKSLVSTWTRSPGCATDHESRTFAKALARKRSRFAYPDDFVEFVSRLRRRMLDKHEKNTDEGRALGNLIEIRVQASPDWNASRVELMFRFVRHSEDVTFEKNSWSELLGTWLDLMPAAGRFLAPLGAVLALEDMTADEYVGSDPLDLDHLSIGGTPA